MKNSARKEALFILQDCRKNGAWPDEKLKSALVRSGLAQRDRALTTRLCYGVLQNRELLDFYIGKFCNIKLKKLHPTILDILRLGAYQIVFLDKIPDRAAVNEAVELTKTSASPTAAPLVNAVLNKLAQSCDCLPQIPKHDFMEYLSIKYSHPKWILDKYKELLAGGEHGGIEGLLEANNRVVPIFAQVNTLKLAKTDEVCKGLLDAGCMAKPHTWLKDSIEITGTGGIIETRVFRDGLIFIQDTAARLAVTAADPKPGQFIIDACAAPGGKSFMAAILMQNKGKILACDIHEHKISSLGNGAKRLGIGIINPCVKDAAKSDPELIETADIVIADVPCSGLGIIRKKPDIRYKNPELLAKLPRTQLDILKNVSKYVKPGGILLYSTCTLLKEENEDIISGFLKTGTDFELCPFKLPEPVGEVKNGYITLWPHIHETDGFFICKMIRR